MRKYLDGELSLSGDEEARAARADNVVLVGKKPLMNYVVACVTSFNRGDESVVLKGRGSAISKVVDVVQVLKRAFVQDLVTRNILIGTEEVMRDGRKCSVSTVEISIEKPKPKSVSSHSHSAQRDATQVNRVAR